MRAVARVLALGLLLSLLVSGCRGTGKAGEFTGEFQAMSLGDAPSILQRHFEQQKAVPGLTVYTQDGQTYLLLRAGRVEEPGMGIQVLAVKPPVKGSRLAQVVAMLQPTPGETGTYPYVLLVLQGGTDLSYRARLSTRSEVPLELPGIPLVEK